jgi:hypothetical protein
MRSFNLQHLGMEAEALAEEANQLSEEHATELELLRIKDKRKEPRPVEVEVIDYSSPRKISGRSLLNRRREP